MLAAGAAFADCGMLALPRELRDQITPLSDLQWRAIRRHPEHSLAHMRNVGIIARGPRAAVGSHHERWDGSGYPDGLVAEAIPPEARYVAIADAYASLTASRRGQHRLSRGDALREMARSTGQFDPRPLRALVHLLARAQRTAESSAESAAA